jgi:hypothetical protein
MKTFHCAVFGGLLAFAIAGSARADCRANYICMRDGQSGTDHGPQLPNLDGTSTVASLQVRNDGAGLVVVHWTDTTLPGCFLDPKDETSGGRAIFSLLIAAWLAGKSVIFTCWGGATYWDDWDVNDAHRSIARAIVR